MATKKKSVKRKSPVKRVRKSVIPVNNSKDIEKEIYNQIESNKNYMVLGATDNIILLVKKQSLTINISITNSVFQPHERRDQKDLYVVTIIEWGDSKETIPIVEELKGMGCNVKKILCVEAVRSALEWI